MKLPVILLLSFLFFGIGTAQDSTVNVDIKDWKYMRETFFMMDSALTNCKNLNQLYEKRIDEYRIEVTNLRTAGVKAVEIIKYKDEQLEKRKEQVRLLNIALEKKNTELWLYRGAGTIALIGLGVLLLK